MEKAGKHLKRSKLYDAGTNKYVEDKYRTSMDVRVPFAETPTMQKKFGEVLNMPQTHMEPLKLLRYKEGEFFKPHNDANSVPIYAEPIMANRVVTLFVFLNTCETGGETHFTRCGIKIQPRAGMGVIHFPAYLETATYKAPASIGVGSKVKAKVKKSTYIGTVREKNGDQVVVEIGTPDGGTTLLTNAEDAFEELQDMRWLQDERVIHEGVAAVDEKYIATQWCYPGDLEKLSGATREKMLKQLHLKKLGETIL
jgi:hypothetical protein